MLLPSGHSTLGSLAFVLFMLGWSFLAANRALAVYSLSFWHYVLYSLAYCFGAISLDVFKRDAVLMKTVSLLAFGLVYFAAPLNLLSLIVAASGFLLNAAGACTLGADRTYYGYEVANLPPLRVTRFPFSWISHPMLVGNIAAFAGTMINAEFRRQWWPLATTHVALNLGLLALELIVTPQRRSARQTDHPDETTRDRVWGTLLSCCLGLTAAALAISGLRIGMARGPDESWTNDVLIAVGTGLGVFAYFNSLHCNYSAPTSLPDRPLELQAEDTK